MRSKNLQRGHTLAGLLGFITIAGSIAFVGMKIVPTVTEYGNIKKAAAQAKAAGSTVHEVRAAFDRAAEQMGITSISGRDLSIVRADSGVDVEFSYEKIIHLVGIASLEIIYEGSTAPALGRAPKGLD